MISTCLHDPLVWDSADDQHVVAAAKLQLAEFGLTRVRNFPAEPRRFVQFLSRFGTPLRYYDISPGAHPEDSVIWRIRYDPAAASRGETHAVDGPLLPHSSQTLRDPRPPYFSMLMVNNGWQHLPPGHNGESVLVRWADAFRAMNQRQPHCYSSIIDTLLTPMPYPGSSEDHPVIYRLPSQAHEFDWGVRLKGNLTAHLADIDAPPPMIAAVEELAAHGRAVAHVLALESADLLLLDNDRWGHGREAVVGSRTLHGHTLFNPRELWSATVA